MNWYLEVFKKYAVFEGRARRKEYWMFTLFNTIIYVVLSIIGGITTIHSHGQGVNWLVLLYALAIILPSLAVQVRRLHDTSRSGWWILIGMVPLVGGIVLIVFMCLDSEPANEYGPNPKQVEA